MRPALRALGVAAVLGVAACGAAAGGPNGPAIIEGADSIDSWDVIIDRARNFIADETGMAADGLLATKVERMTWNDSSLGCPEPGKAYLPVITEGFQVTLKDGEAVYRVNVAGQMVVSCERSMAARMRKTGRQATPAMGFVLEARQDLAERTGLPVTDIAIGSIRPVVWADGILACDTPETEVEGQGRRGYEILLRARTTRSEHVYRAGNELIYCGESAAQE